MGCMKGVELNFADCDLARSEYGNIQNKRHVRL